MILNVYGLPTLSFSLISYELSRGFYIIQFSFNITYQNWSQIPQIEDSVPQAVPTPDAK